MPGAFEQIRELKRSCHLGQIVAVERGLPNQDDSEDVPPLTFGRLTGLPIPEKLLQQDVFR